MEVGRRLFLLGALSAFSGIVLPERIVSAEQVERNTPAHNSKKVYGIDSVVKAEDKSDFQSYYNVSGLQAPFEIAQYKESKDGNIFISVYSDEDKREGKLFSSSSNPSLPVATIDAKEAGLEGVFKVYNVRGSYQVKYSFEPLIFIPPHTEVSSDLLLTVDNALKVMPDKLIRALNNKDFRLMLAKNVEDSYYRLNYVWRNEDRFYKVDASEPWIQKRGGVWIDNRQHRNMEAKYFNNMLVIPQQYVEYGTSEVIDQGKNPEALKETVFLGIGRAIDHLGNPRYSDKEAFVAVYNTDAAKISYEVEEKNGQFFRNRREPFAEITGALLDGFSKDRTERILSLFPKAVEHVRKAVLSRYN